MLVCDYCEERIENQGVGLEPGQSLTFTPQFQNVGEATLHPECMEPFMAEARKIKGDRPRKSPTTSREVAP